MGRHSSSGAATTRRGRRHHGHGRTVLPWRLFRRDCRLIMLGIDLAWVGLMLTVIFRMPMPGGCRAGMVVLTVVAALGAMLPVMLMRR